MVLSLCGRTQTYADIVLSLLMSTDYFLQFSPLYDIKKENSRRVDNRFAHRHLELYRVHVHLTFIEYSRIYESRLIYEYTRVFANIRIKD